MGLRFLRLRWRFGHLAKNVQKVMKSIIMARESRLDASRARFRTFISTPLMIVIVLDTHPEKDAPGKVADQFIYRLSPPIESGDRRKNDST